MILKENRQKYINMKTTRFFALLALLLVVGGMKLQAQYEGLIVNIDYFDPTSPKEERHIEMLYDMFTNRYVLTVSSARTIYSNGSTTVRNGIAKSNHHHRSKTTTDTIINLSKEDFNELTGDCYLAASTFISTKMKTSAYEIIDGAQPTITLSIDDGPVTMEFLFKCPICPQDNPCEEQFRDILARIIHQGGLDSEKILGNCE